MRSILIPVDGSPQGEAAVRAVVAQARREPIAAIHVLNVQPPLGRYVTRFFDRRTVREFQRDEGARCIAGARRILDNAGLPFRVHVRRGRIARTIGETAMALGVDEVVMSPAEGGLFGNLRIWLLISAVRRHADVPVIAVLGAERGAKLEFPVDRLGTTVPR
jgi:nucleotide-binding universal stress UspA family protein